MIQQWDQSLPGFVRYPTSFIQRQQSCRRKAQSFSHVLPSRFQKIDSTFDSGNLSRRNTIGEIDMCIPIFLDADEFLSNPRKDVSTSKATIQAINQVDSSPIEVTTNRSLYGIPYTSSSATPTDLHSSHRKGCQLSLKSSTATKMYINTRALKENLIHFRSSLQAETKVMFMIKANAYGCDMEPLSQWLEKTGMIDSLAVAFVEEGIRLREVGCSLPIMVLNVNGSAFELCQTYNLQPVIYSIELLKELIRWIQETNQSMFKLFSLNELRSLIRRYSFPFE